MLCRQTAFIKSEDIYAVRTRTQVKRKLAELRRVEKKEGYLIEEIVGEIQALEYVLEERNDL
jgi:hypothetical protein